MNKIGDAIRISGMNYTVIRIQWSPDSAIPTYILKRTFDGSFHYARCTHLTRFTHIKRIEDVSHEGMDKTDVMVGMDEAYRRI